MKHITFLLGTILFTAIPNGFEAVAAATPIKITVIAFGGKVKINSADGQSIVPAKGAVVPIGSKISTGTLSWIDLAQGGLSTIRVMARTEIFEITESSFEEKTKKTSSLFKVRRGSAFVSVSHKALGKGSKYQVQMPELIVGVVGSECQAVSGRKGDTIMNVKGDIIGTLSSGVEVPLTTGDVLVQGKGQQGPGLFTAPKSLMAQLAATSQSMSQPTGNALGGGPTGGTADGEMPDADTFVSSVEGGSLEGISDSGADDDPLISAPPSGSSSGSAIDPSKAGTAEGQANPPPPPPLQPLPPSS